MPWQLILGQNWSVPSVVLALQNGLEYRYISECINSGEWYIYNIIIIIIFLLIQLSQTLDNTD